MPAQIRPAELINKYYADHPLARQILFEHSRQVTRKALSIARRLSFNTPVDLQFIGEAAMLHDIGILATDAPDIGCQGSSSYLEHGIAGREILEREGLPKHALVCERHIGVGLTANEIREQKLPLPHRDMQPISLEEQIICYSDLYFSKSKKNRGKEKSPDDVRKSLQRFGDHKLAIFDRWRHIFEHELS